MHFQSPEFYMRIIFIANYLIFLILYPTFVLVLFLIFYLLIFNCIDYGSSKTIY